MHSASEKVIQLRQLLAERFGQGRLTSPEVFVTGVPLLDQHGVPRAAITEIVVSSVQGSGMLLLCGLLHSMATRSERVAVVDGKDSLHPCGLPQGDLQRVLWTRCTSVRESMQAVDLLVRDGNFSVVVVLLGLNASSELRRLPSTTWHRFHMLAEKSATALLVFTSFPMVGCASLRLSARSDFPLEKLHVLRSGLANRLSLYVERRRERNGDEMVRRAVCA